MNASRQRAPGSLLAIFLLLCACGGLPKTLRQQYSVENDQLQTALQQVQRTQDILHQDLAKNPGIFRNVTEPDQWAATLRSAQQQLDTAKNDNAELARIVQRNRSDSRQRAQQLLAEEHALRLAAVRESQSVDKAITDWLAVSRDPAHYVAQAESEYDSLESFDLAPISKTVTKAEQDWPAKKDALQERLNAVSELPKTATVEWDSTGPARQDVGAGKLTGPDIASLLRTDTLLSRQLREISAKTGELRNLCDQLYYSWDKILTDLDTSREGSERLYRERIKTVRTHIVDVSAKKGETSSSDRWVDVGPAEYHAVEKDLGMVIAHKDAGQFDSEAQTTPQPPGFAYIAPESQGSNQYGYWTHNSHGESVWTWLPQYLILRELLRGPDYRPIILDEYRGYRVAETSGRTYYGQTTPTSPPRYGTQGTYTQTRYAQSRYAQHGGFGNSAYAFSHNGNGAGPLFGAPHPDEHRGMTSNNGAGRRFGSGVSPSSGRRFGGGFRSGGRSFGRRR